MDGEVEVDCTLQVFVSRWGSVIYLAARRQTSNIDWWCNDEIEAHKCSNVECTMRDE